MRVAVQADDFDLAAEAAALERTGAGAVVTFTGIVRDVAGGLRWMEIEHYPAMTRSALEGIAAQAAERWSLTGATVIHRYGSLAPGARIMMVATASAHRRAAFEAADFLMDYLKSRAPFWKKEVREDGADWVAAKDDDEAALGRW
ncbi:molybdenum cofactor biosynthesis protein MoaE [Jannaschia sp. LMIT008]|uniref:molybdenum cofactor biosynthesis protein MoaE n=1 Tax=Jannaschia maritima TaxID=3032585 RepID=UPI002810D10A|nr:molybdenum cofactor biosynthesis protein MoaE [Jannaschia sp. LMIT008]